MSIPNYLYALANHQGPATIEAGGMRIPVKIMDLEHKDNAYGSYETTFNCLVVNQDQIKQTNAFYGTQMADCVRRELARACGAKPVYKPNPRKVDPMKIDRVIFNNPATIVIWADGTKTVVKCQESDVYSKETGLALCIAKKALGNKGNFNDVFHEWIPEEEEAEDPYLAYDEAIAKIKAIADKAGMTLEVEDNE